MEEVKEITEKERERRRKISEYRKKMMEEKRKKGYQAYLKRKRKEKAQKEKEKAKEKEKERLRREKEKVKPKKRKVGRPKKRGPKKVYKRKKPTTPKVNIRNTKAPYIYKIISCRNGVQNKFIGKYRTIEDAYEEFNNLKMQERMVVFPRMESVDSTIKNSIDEYLIIEKSDGETSILRNEYGKLVEQKTNLKGWTILDKYRYHGEESFWVWGYNPRNDRKDFTWVYRNFVYENSGSLDYIRIILYKNKVIFKDDNGYMEIVFCKSESDAIRVYNKLEEWSKRDKIKRILFLGDFSEISNRRRKLEDEIIALTGWTRRKVQMKNTTYYTK